MELLPLAIVALIIWIGVFAFTFSVDRKITDLEKRIEDRQRERDSDQ